MNDEDEIELASVGMDDESDGEEVIRSAPTGDLRARRRLEARLEERRLEKLIRDYDFDIDESA